MPAVAPVPFVPYRQFDDDGDPLAGGRLYTYAAGTDTLLAAYQDPQGTVLHSNPILLDDAGYNHIYLRSGVSYKLVQTDSAGVQQWEVDQVTGSGGGGGSATAGLGWGKNTVRVQPAAGTGQATASVFPASVLALALTVWIEAALGTSQGLTAVGIGTHALPDCWGMLQTLAAATESTAGLFQGYGAKPQPQVGVVALTAYGGRFDGSGVVYVTGHWCTFLPGHDEGYAYSPSQPPAGALIPPQPVATETLQGIVELADATEVLEGTDLTRAVTIGRLLSRTSTETRLGLTRYGTPAETTTGTLRTVATHPAGVKAAVDAKVPAGTPLSVARYATGGTALESAPLTVDAAGNLALGPVVPGTSAQRALVLASGVAPSAAHPADAVQIWVADIDGVAGTAGVHVRTEPGVLTRIGTGLLARQVALVIAPSIAAPYAAVVEESGKVLIANNVSVMAQVTLPSAVAGVTYTCLVHVVQGLRVRAAAGQNIRLGSVFSAAGGAIESITVGNYLTLLAINTTQWQVMSPPQNWALIA